MSAYFKENVIQLLQGFLNEPDLSTLIEIPPDRNLGDLAFPCFRLAKTLKKAPPLIAKELAENVKKQAGAAFFKEIKAIGPYVNFFLDYKAVSKEILPKIESGAFFKVPAKTKLPKTMIEFSQPNTHKAFHVGHCRNVALGDALVRMNRFLGYVVIAANYIGDDGAHIAKCLWYYTKYKPSEKPTGDAGEWLGGLYAAATKLLEDAPEEDKKTYQKEISILQQKMEGKDPAITKLWLETKQWSMESFHKVYDWLDIKFDIYFYESEVLAPSQLIVSEFLKKGTFVESQGAIGIDLNEDSLGFFLLLKSDGTTLYSTRDLALAQKKFKDFGIERSIYVVGSEQEHHFRQVFKTLEKMGFDQVKNCFHLSYGMVVLPEGKMSSRAGNVINFSALKERLMTEIKDVVFKEVDLAEWSQTEIDETAKKVAISAIKYGMIASDPKKNIVFDMSKWVSFHGDTGPYLLYTNVRMKSILRKAQFQGFDVSKIDAKIFDLIDEKNLFAGILNFHSVVERGVRENSPAPIATYLYELCQTFNTLYSKVSILRQEDEKIKAAYLHLISALSKTLTQGCELLGIEVPERM